MLDKLKVLSKYKMFIIDEIDYLYEHPGYKSALPAIARRYKKPTVFTSTKTFSQMLKVTLIV